MKNAQVRSKNYQDFIEFYTLVELSSNHDTTKAIAELKKGEKDHKITLATPHSKVKANSFDELRSDALVVSAASAQALGEVSYHQEGISYLVAKTDSATVSVYLQIKGVSYSDFTNKTKFAPVYASGQIPHKQGEEFALGEANYRVEKLFGRGGIGSVYQVKDTSTGEIKALKTINNFSNDHAGLMYSHFHMRHLPKVFSFFQNKDQYNNLTAAYLMEALDDFVYSPEAAEEITELLSKLHKLGVVHNDISPGNIMSKNSRSVFIDYGTEIGGTMFYSSNAFSGTKNDISALGSPCNQEI